MSSDLDRRGFFGRLLALVVAPKIVPEITRGWDLASRPDTTVVSRIKGLDYFIEANLHPDSTMMVLRYPFQPFPGPYKIDRELVRWPDVERLIYPKQYMGGPKNE